MDFKTGNDLYEQQKKDVNHTIRQTKLALPTSNPTVATIVAKAVTVRKLENNELITVGKYGFALAGDVKLNYFQLLLYGSKNSVLVNLILTKDFEYKVNENNIVEFLSKENWQLEFMNTNDAVDFNLCLAFVLWKLNGSKKLFWIDLYYPSRDAKVAKLGNIVEITYVANAIQGKTFGPEVSNNINDDKYLKVNISKEGWERSLAGVNVGTKRVVFIPIAEMGAWKILTNGRQSLCLTMTAKDVYSIKEDNNDDLSVVTKQEQIVETFKINSALNQSKEHTTFNDNNHITETHTPSKTVCIETLYDEFEKLKIDNIKTNERLTKLEALFKDMKPEKIENSTDIKFKKSMKSVYKRIIQEFPIDQMFSGSQIHTIVKDIFHNVVTNSNQNHSNENID